MFTQQKFADIEALETNDQARDFIRAVRWTDGFECPRCHSSKGYALEKRKMIECANCGKQTSPTANTIYHGSRTPLLDIKLLFLFATGSNTSARALSQAFSICYTTMWHHAHVSRLALESICNRQKSQTIDCARLKRALFKQSKEEKLTADQSMSSLSELSASEELVLQTINFILIVFNGVSRKFAQSYVAQFGWFVHQEPVADLETMLRKALTFGRTARRHLRNYRSPPAVFISTQ